MSRLRVHSFSISIDGYGAGPRQDLHNPLGFGGPSVPIALVLAVLSLTLVCYPSPARGASSSGTTTFILDGNRVYAEVGLVRPDGSTHRALLFVDTGSPSMVLKESLFKELQLDQGKPLLFRIGKLPLEVARG